MADIGGIQFQIQVVNQQVKTALDQTIKAFNQLQDKMGEINQSNENTNKVISKVVKTLGAAGLGGAFLYARHNSEAFRTSTDKLGASVQHLVRSLIPGTSEFGKFRLGLQGVSHVMHEVLKGTHLAEGGLASLSKALRPVIVQGGGVALALKAVGTAAGALPGPLGAAGQAMVGIGTSFEFILHLGGLVAELLGHRMVESGRRMREETLHSIDEFLEYERALFGVKVAVEAYNHATGESQSVEKFIKIMNETAVVTGLARGEIALAQLSMLEFTQVTKLNADQIGKLVKISADFAKAAHQDFQTTVRGIDFIFRGYYQTLQAVGISITEAQIKQEAMRQGLIKSNEAMSETVKATAVYELLLKKLAPFQGKSAELMGTTYVGALQRAQVATSNINIAMGEGAAAADEIRARFIAFILEVIAGNKALLTFAARVKGTVGALLFFGGHAVGVLGTVVKLVFGFQTLITVLGIFITSAHFAAVETTFLGSAIIGLTTFISYFGMATIIAYTAGIAALVVGLALLAGWLFKTWENHKRLAAAHEEGGKQLVDYTTAILKLNEEGQKWHDRMIETEKDTIKESQAIRISTQAAEEQAAVIKANEIIQKASHKLTEEEIKLIHNRVIAHVRFDAVVKEATRNMDGYKEAIKRYKTESRGTDGVTRSIALGLQLSSIEIRRNSLEMSKAVQTVHLYRESMKLLNEEAKLGAQAMRAHMKGVVQDLRESKREFQQFNREVKKENEDLQRDLDELKVPEEDKPGKSKLVRDRESLELQEKVNDLYKERAGMLTRLQTQLKEIEDLEKRGTSENEKELIQRKEAVKGTKEEIASLNQKIDARQKIVDGMVKERAERELSAEAAEREEKSAQNRSKIEESRIQRAQTALEVERADLTVAMGQTAEREERVAIQEKLDKLAVRNLELERESIKNQINLNKELQDIAERANKTETLKGLRVEATTLNDRYADINVKLRAQRTEQEGILDTLKKQNDELGNQVEDLENRNDITRDGLQLQIETDQLALEAARTTSEQTRLQLRINEAKKQIHLLNIQELIDSIALKQSFIDQGKLTADAAKETQRDIDAQKKKIPILQQQTEVYEEQGKQIKENADDAVEVGRNLEESIAGAVTGFAFGDLKKPRDAFKQLGKDIQETFKQSFANTIKNKLSFEGMVSKNIFKDKGGLGSIFTGFFGQVTKQSEKTFKQDIPEAAKEGTDKTTQVVQSGAEAVAGAADSAAGPWSIFFNQIVSWATQAFGAIGGIAMGALGGIFGMFQKLLGMIGIGGGGGGGGGAAQATGGGWLDSVLQIGAAAIGLFGGQGNVGGVAGLIKPAASFLFGQKGLFPQVGAAVQGMSGGAAGKALNFIGDLGNFALTAVGAYQSISALFSKKQSGVGRLMAGAGAIENLSSLIGQASAFAGYGIVPLKAGGLAVMSGGQVTGILSSSGFVPIQGGASLASVGQQGGLISGTARGGLGWIGGVAKTAYGAVFGGGAQAVGQAAPGFVGPIAPGAGGPAPAAAGAGYGPALGAIGGGLAIAGGAYGVYSGIKQYQGASGPRGKAGGALQAGAGVVGIAGGVAAISAAAVEAGLVAATGTIATIGTAVWPLLIVAAVMAIVAAILTATQEKPDITKIIKENFAGKLEAIMNAKVSEAMGDYLGAGVPGKVKIRKGDDRGDIISRREAIDRFKGGGAGGVSFLGRAAVGLYGETGLRRPELAKNFTNMMSNVLIGRGAGQAEIDKAVRNITKLLFGNVYSAIAKSNLYQKAVLEMEGGTKDAGKLAKNREEFVKELTDFGRAFKIGAVDFGKVLVGAIKEFKGQTGKIKFGIDFDELKKSLRLEAIASEMSGFEFTIEEARAIGDKFLINLKKLQEETPDSVNIMEIAKAVAQLREGDKKLIAILKTATELQSLLVQAALPLADTERLTDIAEYIESLHGKNKKRAKQIAGAFLPIEVAVDLAIENLENAVKGISFISEGLQAQRNMAAAEAKFDVGAKALEKPGKFGKGKKGQQAFEETVQSTAEAAQEMIDATVAWGQALLDLQAQIKSLTAESKRAILQLDMQILQLNADLGVLGDTATDEIGAFYDQAIADTRALIAASDNEMEKLNLTKQLIDQINEKYAALIQQVEAEAAAKIKVEQDAIDAINEQLDLLGQMRDYMEAIQALQNEMRRALFDLDRQIASLRDLPTTVADVGAFFDKSIADIKGLMAQTTDPLMKLDLMKELVGAINEKYSEMINQAEENARIRIDALNDELAIVQAIADLNKQVKADLEALRRSPTRARLTPGRRVAEARSDIAAAKAAFESAKPEDKAAAGEKLRQAYMKLLQIAEESYQKPSAAYQKLLAEVTHGMEDLDASTSGAADRAEAILADIKKIQDDTKIEVEGIRKSWAADLEGIKPDLKQAYLDATVDLNTKLADVVQQFDDKFPDSANSHKNIGDINQTMIDLEAARVLHQEAIDKIQDDTKVAVQDLKKAWVDDLQKTRQPLIDAYNFAIIWLAGEFAKLFGPNGDAGKALESQRVLLDLIEKKMGDIKTAAQKTLKGGPEREVRASVKEARQILNKEGKLTKKDRENLGDIFNEIGDLFDQMGLNGAQWHENAAAIIAGTLGDDNIRNLLKYIIGALPKAGAGALLTRDTVIRAGERGKEAVLPLESAQSKMLLMNLFDEILQKLWMRNEYGGTTRGGGDYQQPLVLNTTVNVANAQGMDAEQLATLVDRRITRSLQFGRLREGTRNANLQGRVVRNG